MGLTDFGKALRMARLNVGATMAEMAEALEMTPSFLSNVETGRKKVPQGLPGQARAFFQQRGCEPADNLEALADVANKTVPLEGLSPHHQMLVAGFARASLSADQLTKLADLLAKVDSTQGGRK